MFAHLVQGIAVTVAAGVTAGLILALILDPEKVGRPYRCAKAVIVRPFHRKPPEAPTPQPRSRVPTRLPLYGNQAPPGTGVPVRRFTPADTFPWRRNSIRP